LFSVHFHEFMFEQIQKSSPDIEICSFLYTSACFVMKVKGIKGEDVIFSGLFGFAST